MDERERARYEVLSRIVQGEALVPAEICGCESVPVNYWLHRDGSWSSHPTTGSGAEDAALFRRRKCVGWVVACPRCGRHFMAGLRPGHLQVVL